MYEKYTIREKYGTLTVMLKHLRTRFPLVFGLFILLVGIFIGERFGLYYRFAHFDKVMHILGGLAVAWMVMSILQNDISRMSMAKQAMIIISVTCMVGVLWEFAEYLSNFTRYSYPWWYHYYHGGDLADTLGDLIADIGGAVLFSAWALWKERS